MAVVEIDSKYYLSLILEARGILETKKIERLTKRITHLLKGYNIDAYNEALMCGASLAHQGLLGNVYRLRLGLCDVDLSPVPAQHLASLISCVTKRLRIQNLSGSDLVSVLTSLKQGGCG